MGAHLSGKVGGASLGDLEDDRGLGVTGGLKGSNDGRGGGDVLKIIRFGLEVENSWY